MGKRRRLQQWNVPHLSAALWKMVAVFSEHDEISRARAVCTAWRTSWPSIPSVLQIRSSRLLSKMFNATTSKPFAHVVELHIHLQEGNFLTAFKWFPAFANLQKLSVDLTKGGSLCLDIRDLPRLEQISCTQFCDQSRVKLSVSTLPVLKKLQLQGLTGITLPLLNNIRLLRKRNKELEVTFKQSCIFHCETVNFIHKVVSPESNVYFRNWASNWLQLSHGDMVWQPSSFKC